MELAAVSGQLALPEGQSRDLAISASGAGKLKASASTRQQAARVFDRLNAEASRRQKKQKIREQELTA